MPNNKTVNLYRKKYYTIHHNSWFSVFFCYEIQFSYNFLITNIISFLFRDIPVKRTICKGCRTLLLAGVTAKVRIKKKNIVWSCLKCNTKKTFETNDDYMPWSQKNESIVETLDFTPNVKRKEK